MYPSHFGTNPLFPTEKDFRVIKKSQEVGCGVITYRSFKEGEIVAAMAGEIIHEIRQHSLQIDRDTHLYDTYFSGYFLHSCSPNIELDMKNLLVYALRDIPPHSYLYMDYAQTEDVLYKQFQCCCGSPNCRGWITGRLEVAELTGSFPAPDDIIPRAANG